MKVYHEWDANLIVKDDRNPFSTLYQNEDGTMFYIEPIFYTQLQAFFQHYPQHSTTILEEMDKIVHTNKKVVFTGDFESPLTHVEHAIYLEIFDITDRLNIFVEDKSRGSDYGD